MQPGISMVSPGETCRLQWSLFTTRDVETEFETEESTVGRFRNCRPGLGAARIAVTLTAWVLLVPLLHAAPDREYRVAMRDGVKLATDVYLPEGDGPWPAILVMTPYNRKGVEMWAFAARGRGYAFVSQDFRGRFDSEGRDDPVFLSCGWGEHKDGYDTVEWIAGREWCDGKVGGIGISAPGIALNMMAPSRPPHLVCLYSAVAFSDMYSQCAYQGGAFRKALMEKWLEGNGFSPGNLATFKAHPVYDDFWKQYNCVAVADRIEVPVLLLGGWYDIFSEGTLESFVSIREHGGKKARGGTRLVMEPYGHGTSSDLVFLDRNRPRLANLLHCLDWFDIWLKKDGDGIEDIPAVQYYVMGDPDDPDSPGNRWRSADAWPIPARPTPWYLEEGGGLSRQPPTEREASRTYHYDPEDPVPTVGGANLLISKGPKDQREVEKRPDVLTFTSEPLEDFLEITGKIRAKLWVSSSARDTDFTARLCDVYPDGRSMLIVDGILRARFRESFSKDKLLEPGKVYPLEIDLWQTSLVFSKGHRVRVSISSSNAPRFEPNPNTGKLPGEDDTTAVATNTVYMDAERPSHILLPVVDS